MLGLHLMLVTLHMRFTVRVEHDNRNGDTKKKYSVVGWV